MSDLNLLPRRSFNGNWKCKDVKQPEYLVLGLGGSLDQVAEHVASRLAEIEVAGVRIQVPKEVKPQRGNVAALRVVKTDRHVHRASTDVILSRQGNDLYVRYQVQGRTWLRYLKYVLYGSIFLAAWCVLYGIFYSSTRTFESVVQAYLQKWSDSSPVATREALMKGYRYDESTRKAIKIETPITISHVMRHDPYLVVVKAAGPPAIIAAVLGIVLRLLPSGTMRMACRLVGWPTVEEFETMVAAHAVWVEGQLSTVLQHVFEVTADKIIQTK